MRLFLFFVSFIFLNLNILLAQNIASVPMQCSGFEANRQGRGNSKLEGIVLNAIVTSQELLDAEVLLGVNSKYNLLNCGRQTSGDEEEVFFVSLPQKSTQLISIYVRFNTSEKSSTQMFDATSINQAGKTSQFNHEMELINDIGKAFKAQLFFRKRQSYVKDKVPSKWEFYLLFPSAQLANTLGVPGETVIVALGTLEFSPGGELEEVRFWRGENDANHRFFKDYLPEDFNELKAGEVSIDLVDGQHLKWRNSAELFNLIIDFGLPDIGSNARAYEENKNSGVLGYQHDGRPRVSEE